VDGALHGDVGHATLYRSQVGGEQAVDRVLDFHRLADDLERHLRSGDTSAP
jgi:hypothetical protein